MENIMQKSSYSFKIGEFDCTVIRDGTLKIPGSHDMELTCLFVGTGKHNVLIDAGEGKGINPTSGYLLGNMRAAGIDPEDIDKVILTHTHLDHVGGLVDDIGKPSFPNARYIVHKKEWEFRAPTIQVEPEEERKNQDVLDVTARKKLALVWDRFDAFDGASEIIPGFKYILMPGHSPGSSTVVISSEGDQIICVGDIVHDLVELTDPDVWAQFDKNTEGAARSRTQLLSSAASTHALLFVCHFPFPGVGYVAKKDGIFTWEPMVKEQ
jgi:glyoxylase-like metal-dependent hydrolase (beta-lactamase superfamily II)